MADHLDNNAASASDVNNYLRDHIELLNDSTVNMTISETLSGSQSFNKQIANSASPSLIPTDRQQNFGKDRHFHLWLGRLLHSFKKGNKSKFGPEKENEMVTDNASLKT